MGDIFLVSYKYINIIIIINIYLSHHFIIDFCMGNVGILFAQLNVFI